jgi:perosamine synthetase
MDIGANQAFAKRHGLWVVEDAAHAFPAAYCGSPGRRWQWCGENTAAVTCFSFYANKTITTGEGGMAVTDDPDLAAEMRQMSLHGLSRDAWDRRNGHTCSGWDYRVATPGHKYNLTDIAAAIGIHQLRRSEQLRRQRQALARRYLAEFSDLEQLELPPAPPDRLHAWHLFPVRLRLNRLSVGRNAFFDALRDHGVAGSVHYRPLHLHPYYKQTFGWRAKDLPIASRVWKRLISLPLFPSMSEEEQTHVIHVVRDLCHRFAANGNGTTNGRQ